jgi:hypothetical protein
VTLTFGGETSKNFHARRLAGLGLCVQNPLRVLETSAVERSELQTLQLVLTVRQPWFRRRLAKHAHPSGATRSHGGTIASPSQRVNELRCCVTCGTGAMRADSPVGRSV